MALKDYEFWFVVGSQYLYGPEVLETVAERAQEMTDELNASGKLPCRIVYKVTAKTNKEITDVVREANYDNKCAGIICWCHTFSPSKMWINGLENLQKPYCHLATQYNKTIPNEEINMDFMNLNQAAHGDREHGFIGARLRLPRKIIAGYWKDTKVREKLGDWMRAAVGVAFSKTLSVMRFGDNMREVAVTEGDKVEVQTKLGWQVNTWAVGDLVKEMDAVTDAEIDALYSEYMSLYELNTDNTDAIRYQAREEIAIKKMLDKESCMAFSNTFQDLYGMHQLPGLASQHLMAQGYGFGAEGDWKVAAMTAIVKAMGEGKTGGTSFMEDYTYHFSEDGSYSLGAHMLEVCPSVASAKPKIETHPLGIGMNEDDPARLVFEGRKGPAIVISLIDMGGRLRLIVQDIECIKPILPMPNLPVARVMWQSMPDLETGLECWILAGGAHHTVLTHDVSAEQMKDFAAMTGIEYVHITKDTKPEELEYRLMVSDYIWKNK
ncbi:MAG: L-arabinose isomerase [Clostridiales bacterium]|nr:L-arabinose isomerase [Clostridiales bacterium]